MGVAQVPWGGFAVFAALGEGGGDGGDDEGATIRLGGGLGDGDVAFGDREPGAVGKEFVPDFQVFALHLGEGVPAGGGSDDSTAGAEASGEGAAGVGPLGVEDALVCFDGGGDGGVIGGGGLWRCGSRR